MMETSGKMSGGEDFTLHALIEPDHPIAQLHHHDPSPRYRDITEKSILKTLLINKLRSCFRYLPLISLLFLDLQTYAQPLSVSITANNCSCFGTNDGSATANPTGGNPPYSYVWSTWETEQTIGGLWAGQYDVTVTDEDLTEVTASVMITEPPGTQLTAEITDVSCNGGNDGSIFIDVTGGVPPFVFTWSTGSSESFIEDLEVGSYGLTITDGNSCSISVGYFVSQPLPIDVILDEFSNEICLGSENGFLSIGVMWGTPPYSVVWSNGATDMTISDLAPGNYTVTVTDDHDCTKTETYTIDPGNDVEVALLQIQHLDCYGEDDGSISVTGSDGNNPYTYTWSNGDTGPAINDLFAAVYTVTVSDEDECAETASYEILQPEDLVIDLVNLNAETCEGNSDGTITIEIGGGNNPYQAEWSNGQTGISINNLDPGFYTVTVTDDPGCQETETYYVDPGTDIQVELVESQNISCFGGSDGELSVDASQGAAPYEYIWSNGMTGFYINGLPAMMFTCTVTDDFGCTDVSEYVLSEPTAMIISLIQTNQNPCYGDTLAGLSAMISGGTPGYTGQWSDNSAGLENTNLGAGTYTITVTDANSCLSTQAAVIIDPPILSTTVSATGETGLGANDGTATAVPGGGTPTYSFLWSNGDTSATITALPPGLYSVTITDINECSVTGMEQVPAYGCTLDVMAGTDYSMCEEDTSMITPIIAGAAGNVTYLWSDGSTDTILLVSQGGEFCVTVTDEGNCQNVDCIIITENILPPLTCPVTDESVPDANDGAIQCDSLPGNISYAWSNGETTPFISGLSPGEYCVTSTDGIGCSNVQCFIVQPANCILSHTSEVTHVSCYSQSTGSITLHLTGATEPVTYIWSNGNTGSVADQLPAGQYLVSISDAGGCFDQDTFMITEPPAMVITLDSIAPADQSGSGFIGITVSGGNPGYAFQWTDPAGGMISLEDLEGLSLTGYYFLVVTDSLGCTARLDSVFVDQGVTIEDQIPFKTIRVYPVPADDMLYVDLENAITELMISGADGRIYKRVINPGSNQIDVSDIGPGWYVLRMADGKDLFMARMVK